MNKFCRIAILAAVISMAHDASAAGSQLRVTCADEDAGAEVYINGKFKGECPLDMQVQEGTLKLRVVKAVDANNERVFEKDIRMGDGVAKKVEAALSSRLTAAGQKHEAKSRAEFETAVATGTALGKAFRDCADCPEMVVIPAGSFEMGSNNGKDSEKPAHRVTIGKIFALGKTEITRGQFAAFVNETNYVADDGCFGYEGGKLQKLSQSNWHNPGFPQDDSHPAACINWNDAKVYTDWLSRKTGKQYRLPSEAEWEYACRAGGRQQYCGSDNLDSVGWYGNNSGNSTHPVSRKQANAFGLYDMSGNVWEWVEDSNHDSYNGGPTDGSVWVGDGAKRVLRGGSWDDGPQSAGRRLGFVPALRYIDVGFRIIRMLP